MDAAKENLLGSAHVDDLTATRIATLEAALRSARATLADISDRCGDVRETVQYVDVVNWHPLQADVEDAIERIDKALEDR